MHIQMGFSKMRSEPSEYMWRTGVTLTHMESYFEERAQDVSERSWMNPDMHTTLLDMNILKPIPGTLLEWEPILKVRGGFWERQPGKYSLKIWS